MKRSEVVGAIALGAAFLAAGCSSEGPSFGEVRGRVTLDGKTLDEGVVRFVPIDGKTSTASALIEHGQFSERVPVGNHRVEISAPKLPKGFNSSKELKRGTVDEGVALEELIPQQYNSHSKLTAEVRPGPNDLQFDLKSQ